MKVAVVAVAIGIITVAALGCYTLGMFLYAFWRIVQ